MVYAYQGLKKTKRGLCFSWVWTWHLETHAQQWNTLRATELQTNKGKDAGCYAMCRTRGKYVSLCLIKVIDILEFSGLLVQGRLKIKPIQFGHVSVEPSLMLENCNTLNLLIFSSRQWSSGKSSDIFNIQINIQIKEWENRKGTLQCACLSGAL